MVQKIITISFPFIDREQTANKKNGKNRWVAMVEKDELLRKCFSYVKKAMESQEVKHTYFGCVLHRYWFFTGNRSHDEDNFCSGTKYYTDSLKHAGLIIDDSNRHIIGGDIFHFDGQEEEKLVYIMEMIESKEQFNFLRQQKKENLFISKMSKKEDCLF